MGGKVALKKLETQIEALKSKLEETHGKEVDLITVRGLKKRLKRKQRKKNLWVKKAASLALKQEKKQEKAVSE